MAKIVLTSMYQLTDKKGTKILPWIVYPDSFEKGIVFVDNIAQGTWLFFYKKNITLKDRFHYSYLAKVCFA